MRLERLAIWIQIATVASVGFGLGLVVYELRQVQTLSRAQLTSDAVATVNSIYTAMLGENAAEIVAKACLSPETLTLQESVVLDNYYLSNANQLAKLALLTDRDGIYPAGYWQENMFYINPVLASEYGREWLVDRRTGWPAGFLEAVHERIRQLGPPNCESDYQERISRIKHGNSSYDTKQ